MISRAARKAGVVEDQPCAGAFVAKLETYQRVGARIPRCLAPGLDEARAGGQLDVAARDEAAEDLERAAGLGRDLGRRRSDLAGARRGAELDDGVELRRGG